MKRGSGKGSLFLRCQQNEKGYDYAKSKISPRFGHATAALRYMHKRALDGADTRRGTYMRTLR